MDHQEPYSVQATAAIAAVITFLILFTIFGNALVILAVLTSRSLRAPQNLFLVSLAAADILVATLIIPFSLANELLGYWYFRRTWCEVYLALDVLFCTSSIVHLCAISLDRYWAVSRALEYNSKRTPRRIKCIILTVWLIAAVISLPPLIYKGDQSPQPRGRPQCKLNQEAWYILASSIGSFFAPCLIMILVYLRIYLIAKRSHRRGPRAKGGPGKGDSEQPCRIPGEVSASAKLPTLVSQLATAGEANGRPHPTGEKDEGETPEDPGTPALPPNWPSLPNSGQGQKEGVCGTSPEEEAAEEEEEEEEEEECEPQALPASPASACSPPLQQPQVSRVLATLRGQVLLGRGTGTSRGQWWRRRAQLTREKRFTFVLAVVIGVFVLCWFPFFFSYSLGAICPEHCKVPRGLFQFFFWIGYCNSSLNPVIYTIFNQDFRRAFRRILCRQWTQTAW
ncbi:Alpha-2B adrenergic receptor [Camelus dromedarius]|uniref:Alpha-2B adrenergic receptor n=1 Tax=Camelus dromedarius TaxID=9838 RepID=A0A5N4CCZ5_CAMDR|nr:alpha-2B adrenergic receptor [Camelus dromedarius]KAB1256766.1 Alpha-2B adrenergic receptor [Camelus dromedarius]